jgi:hypothetical protein
VQCGQNVFQLDTFRKGERIIVSAQLKGNEQRGVETELKTGHVVDQLRQKLRMLVVNTVRELADQHRQSLEANAAG